MITYYVATSLDGYIAGENDNLDFLELAGKNHDYGYYHFYNSVDICVMGKRTYEVLLNLSEYPYPSKESWVLTRSKTGVGENGETFAAFDPEQWKEATKEKHIWLVGGGEMANLFLSAGLIDKLIVTYIPALLGGGVPLFASGFAPVHWTLLKIESWDSGVTQSTYVKR